jgi:hypothetical protein
MVTASHLLTGCVQLFVPFIIPLFKLNSFLIPVFIIQLSSVYPAIFLRNIIPVVYIVTILECDYRRGMVIWFVEHVQSVTTSNYSAFANSRTLQFTTARNKSSQSALSSPVDILLLPDSRPGRLATISHQPPILLTAVSRLLCNGS